MGKLLRDRRLVGRGAHGTPVRRSSSAGVIGIGYTVIVIRRASRQRNYKPVLEDWLWHCVFPFIAYVALMAGGLELEPHAMLSLFAVAGAVMLLLFIGIHNAWDTVTYLVIARPKPESGAPKA